MDAYDNTEYDSFLDKLDSSNRQLWVILGRQNNKQTMNKLKREIEQKSNLIRAIRPYERYSQLKNKEIGMRILLDQVQNVLEEIKKETKVLSQQCKQLKTIKAESLNLISQIKNGQQMEYKIKKMMSEVESINEMDVQLDEKTIVNNYLGIVGYIKKKILEAKQSKTDEIEEDMRKIQTLQDCIENERKIWEELTEEKYSLQKQLSYIREKRMTSEIRMKEREESTQRQQIIQGQLIEDTIPNYKVVKKITHHTKIVSKSKTPQYYYYWIILLLLWGIFLCSCSKSNFDEGVFADDMYH